MFPFLPLEGLRAWLIPLQKKSFEELLASFGRWYNGYRLHMTLDGCTPNEIYYRRQKANEQPRREPRKNWPRKSKCAAPLVKKLRAKRGAPFKLRVTHLDGHKHLPIITLVAA